MGGFPSRDMVETNAVIRVGVDVESVIAQLEEQRIEATQVSDVAMAVPLDVGRGDRVIEKRDGNVEVVQDALSATIIDADIVEVRD